MDNQEKNYNNLQEEILCKTQKDSPELHLIVLWHNARYKEKEILEDIQINLQIVDCYSITWSKDKVANNFTRFYGEKLDSGSFKEKECGTDSFLLVTVMDNSPVYEFAETSRGFEYVNINLFNLKAKYREWTRGGHKIHTTNTPKETNHDITLLLGVNYEDYLKEHNGSSWDGTIKSVERDLTGADGWKSIEELFYTLNATVNYVVLRGLEDVNNYVFDEEHYDIDLFTDEYQNLIYLINGKAVINLKNRPKYLVKTNSDNIYLDLWTDTKCYYDYNWQKNMLKTRQFSKGFYTLDNENTFYELIYHCLIHKNKISDIYYDKAKLLFEKLGLNNEFSAENYKFPFDMYYEMLLEYMKSKAYSFVKSLDESVLFNTKVIDLPKNKEYIENKYQISDIKPYMVNEYNGGGSGYVYYTGYKNGKKVFIKYGGIGESAKNEYVTLKALYDKNPNNFLKPYYYDYDKHKLIITEFVNGIGLGEYLKANDSNEDIKKNIFNQLENIAKALIEAKIMHRDLRPANIIVTEDLRLVVIDTQFAVHFDNYCELECVLRNKENFSNLGEDYKVDSYVWDDMYSLDKMCNLVGYKSDFITQNIGKNTIKLKDKKENILKKIFSIKNVYHNKTKRKIITILGFKISLKTKNKN